jgi:hypothetical protein
MQRIVKALRAPSEHTCPTDRSLDEPIDLPEGAAVEVLLSDGDDLTTEERDELETEIDESAAQFARGEFEDARAFAHRLAAGS